MADGAFASSASAKRSFLPTGVRGMSTIRIHGIPAASDRRMPGVPSSELSSTTSQRSGGLVCAGLIETHIHLDKSRIIERCSPEETREVNPVKSVAPLKATFTVEDTRMRAAQTLEQCILHGATRMRTQVEVDPGIGLRGYEAIASLIADYRWAIDIEMCVFPQDGLTNYPGTDELLVEALRRGARAVGGAPRYDTDGVAQINRIFELGREFDGMARGEASGALLVDAGLNLNPHAFNHLRDAADRHGFFESRMLICEVYPAKVRAEHIDFLRGIGQPLVGIGLQSFDNGVLAHVERSYDEGRFEQTFGELSSSW